MPRGRRRSIAALVVLVAVWGANWSLTGLRTHLLFFPLWTAYVFAVDGWLELRSGSSPWSRSRSEVASLFVWSAPGWWLFELFNLRLRNWEYLGAEHFGDLEYGLLCTLSFTTVLPAVLVTAELVRSFDWIERFASGPRIAPTPVLLRGLACAGLLSLAATLIWPRQAYPLLWVGGVLVLEPLCQWLGRGGLLDDLERGDWRPWASLWTAGLVCGFLWELWNALSYPKWTYHVPGVEFAHLFEMPALGYLGYLPFALQLALLRRLVLSRATTPDLAPD